MDIEEAEVLFARKLADCEPAVRRKAFSRLRRWVASRMKAKESFQREDLLTLWKGLYYCMWMQDKPLLHEELADRLCALGDDFTLDGQRLLYMDTFLETIGREWFNIDKWRVDKFMMLFRRLFRHALGWLKSRDWDEALWREFVAVLSKSVWSSDRDVYPEELKCHFASIYLDELDGAGGFALPADRVSRFFDVYINLLTNQISTLFFKSILTEIFDTVLVDFAENICPKPKKVKRRKHRVEKSVEPTKLDYGALSDSLLEAGMTRSLAADKRGVIYKLANQFRAAANGDDPFHSPFEFEKKIDDNEIEQAALNLMKMTERGSKRQKRRLRAKKRSQAGSTVKVQKVKKRKLQGIDDSVSAKKRRTKRRMDV